MPELLGILQSIKIQRLKLERQAAVKSRVDILIDLRREYVASQPLHSVIPGIGDFLMMAPFKAIVIDLPVEEQVTATNFSDAMENLPSLINNWVEIKEKELLTIMKKSLPSISDDTTASILHLASTLFTCNACHYPNPIGYPQILDHGCRRTSTEGQDPELIAHQLWSAQGISFQETVYTSARGVLEICGLKPDTATTQEISDINPLIECLDCHREANGRLFMRYKNSVRICYSAHTRIDSDRLKMADFAS